MFLTAELVLTILFLAAEKTKATFIAPVGIGLALFVAELTGLPPDLKYDIFRKNSTGLTTGFRGLLHWRFS